MQVLHALWHRPDEAPPALFLWGEASTPVPSPRGGRGSRKPATDVAPHPQCLPGDALAAAAARLGGPLGLTPEECVVDVHLPSLPERPLFSPVLEDPLAVSLAGTPEVRPWRVRGLRLAAGEGATWLGGVAAGLKHGVVPGADLVAWAEASRFLLSLLARERLVPATERSSPAAQPPARKRRQQEPLAILVRAVWRPALDDPRDAERLAHLARHLPPSARAAGASPPGARQVLLEFLCRGTDDLAQRWAGRGAVAKGRGRQPQGPGGAWIEALLGGATELPGEAAALLHMHEEVEGWLRRAGMRAPSGWRTLLRLETPPEEEAPRQRTASAQSGFPWSLSFHLQSVEDSSLQVAADTVWTNSHLPGGGDTHPQDRLLADLGRCVAVFPPVARALREARPTACPLAPEEAVSFLQTSAWSLQQQGFAVQLPAGLISARRGLSLRLQLNRKSPKGGSGSGILGLDCLVDYHWEVSLGGQVVDAEEFLRLADLKIPLVKVRGEWVLLDQDKSQRALAFLQEGPGRMELGRALRLASGLEAKAVGLPVEASFHGELAALGGGPALGLLATPEGFQGELRPYQVRGYSWLAWLRDRGLGACLADDMGLGKTIQLLALLLRNRAEGTTGPSLLVCPTSVVGNWVREVERFAPTLRTLVHHGADRAGESDFATMARGADLVLTTYTLVRRDQELLGQVEWQGLVLDEAQNIKNPDAGQTRAVRELPSSFRVALTGTPVENRLTDLWSLMEFLNPGLLGPRATFEREFSGSGQGAGLDRLRSTVQPFLLRRVKTDPTILPELPPKQESRTWCPLTKEQATLYQAVVQDTMERLESSEGMERRGLVLSTLLRLKQVCNHPSQFLGDGSPLSGRSGKLERLEEMLEEVLAEGDRALVFTQFAELAGTLAGHLRERFGCPVLCLTGKVGRRERDAMVELFQSAQGPPLFVLSLKAGGVGLNLTRASRVFHYDRWWNPAVENQATDRAFRLGQTRGVQVYKFLCQGTLEEAIDRLIESKLALAGSVVGAGEHWLTELDDEHLREILTLRAEAVEP